MGLAPDNEVLNFNQFSLSLSQPSWEKFEKAVEETMQSGQGYELELDVLRPDGSTRIVNSRAQAEQDEDGKVVRLVGTFHDVTELVSTRRAMVLALERLRLATSVAQLGIWDLDVPSGRLDWDDRMFELYGENPKDFEPSFDAWGDHLVAEDREMAVNEAKSALAGHSEFSSTFRVSQPSGEVRHIRGLAGVIRSSGGKPLRMIGVNYDVTAQHRTEIALLSSNALLDEFIRHAPAAIAMLDTHFCYVNTSERWLNDYKLQGQEIFGRSHFEFFPYMLDRWEEPFRRALLGNVEGEAEELVTLSSGRNEWIEWEARPWQNEKGEVGGIIIFSQIITRRKELNAELDLQKKHLESSNKDLEQFAYAASHDLQEPLRAISGCAQLLKKKNESKLDEPARELIAHIVSGTERMRVLITDLLSFSRVGAAQRPLTWLDANVAVTRALASLKSSIEESNAVIEIGDLPQIQGDMSQIALLFQNLISNAIKYRSGQPRIIVNGSSTEQGARFSVKDNGIGIEKEHYERIFQLFSRLHTRQEFAGSGVGLAICQRIVTRMNGRIWVESEFGEGSTFHIFVPAIEFVPAIGEAS